MKLNNTTSEETLIIGGQKEMNFSIDTDNSVIFDILRDKMYSNKIGSIVREVASNSRDANREAGNSDKPIEIIISDSYSELIPEQNCIIFKDRGIGISEERMENVFIKYASSTKRHTNAQTGGFGLGAKTPFSYTDSFYIHTIADGKDESGKRVRYSYLYNALIDESGKGKMILLEQEEVEGQNTGTSIIIPMKKNDEQRFISEVRYYTSLWEDVNYIGSVLSIPKPTVLFDCETYKVVESGDWTSTYKSGIYALVDGIPYPLDTNNNKIEGLHSLYVSLQNQTLFLKFGTGEVSVSATREQIEYSEKTVEAVKRVFRRSVKGILKGYQEEIDKLSLHDLVKHINTMYRQGSVFKDDDPMESGYSKKLMTTLIKTQMATPLKDITYKGETLQSILKNYDERYFRFKNHGFTGYKVEFSEPSIYSDKVKGNILLHTNHPIVLMDTRKDRRRNITLLRECSMFLLLKGEGVDGTLTEQQAEFLSTVSSKFNLDFRLYSEIEKAEVESTNSYVEQPTISVPVRIFDRIRDSQVGESIKIEVDRKTGDFIIPKEESTYYLVTEKLSDYELNWSVRKSLLRDTQLILMTEKSYERYFKGRIKDHRVFRDSSRREIHNLLTVLDVLKQSEAVKDIKDPEEFKRNFRKLAEICEGFGASSTYSDVFSENYKPFGIKDFVKMCYLDEKLGFVLKSVTGVEVDFELVRFTARRSQTFNRIYVNRGTKKPSHKILDILTNYISKLRKEDVLFYSVITNTTLIDQVIQEEYTSEMDSILDRIKRIRKTSC